MSGSPARIMFTVQTSSSPNCCKITVYEFPYNHLTALYLAVTLALKKKVLASLPTATYSAV
jgi:hypothetical protein